jgi:hypothetical protein
LVMVGWSAGSSPRSIAGVVVWAGGRVFRCARGVGAGLGAVLDGVGVRADGWVLRVAGLRGRGPVGWCASGV